MTCKECVRFSTCQDELCTTEYYDHCLAFDDVEEICDNFIDIKSKELKEIISRLEVVQRAIQRDGKVLIRAEGGFAEDLPHIINYLVELLIE